MTNLEAHVERIRSYPQDVGEVVVKVYNTGYSDGSRHGLSIAVMSFFVGATFVGLICKSF